VLDAGAGSSDKFRFIRQVQEDFYDDPRSGRSPIDFIDAKILSALETESFHSAPSLAEVVGVPHSTIICYLPDSLGTKNFHLRWARKI
jgi:hypothetical protein